MLLEIILATLATTSLGTMITFAIWSRRDTQQYVQAAEDRMLAQAAAKDLQLETEGLRQRNQQLATKVAALEAQQATQEAQDATKANEITTNGSPHDVSAAMGELYATPLPGSTADRPRSFTGIELPPSKITSPF